MLFPIAHRAKYSLNIYGPRKKPNFTHLANLFHPKTIDACFLHDGNEAVGGIKTEDNQWNTAGHRERLVLVNEEVLNSFVDLYDEPGTSPLQARLPALHSKQLESVIKIIIHSKNLGDLKK